MAGPKRIFNAPPATHAVAAKANDAMREAILAHVEAMKKTR
jgi:hypothetical protein